MKANIVYFEKILIHRILNKIKTYRWLSNGFLLLTIVVFWMSLRDTQDNELETLVALGFCAVSYLFNFLLKKEKKKIESEEE